MQYILCLYEYEHEQMYFLLCKHMIRIDRWISVFYKHKLTHYAEALTL